MEVTKSQAKEKIKKLIDKYERAKKARQIRRYDEANTRKDFIMPLFQALGWDVYNDYTDREVVEEETAVKGRVDYSFRINNIPQFLLETKALKVDLDKTEWAKQTVTYGWNKGIPWVVLTDFEGLKLFNSEWLVETPRPNLEFTYNEFLTHLDDLWFLSKSSIEKGELDKQAEKWGIKAKRLKVTEKLAADLLKWREALRKYFEQYNQNLSREDIEESVQRVLDRLIFIRVCEDRKLEPPILWPTLQKWITHDRKPHNFMQALKPIFKEFDKNYNSNLFQEHLCDRLDTEGTPFEQIINDLYADKEKGVKYNFAAIPPDVLGSIYEQYLGYIQEKGTVNETKRKKHGIYYTPEFIVDYIVQNTLGLALKERSLREIENIKVLDPACGSGSFLIKAFDVLDEYFKEERAQKNAGSAINAVRKFSILKNNIYGVDLDSQAIEIARLNLLLKALEPSHKLPMLSDNTKVGNSLISGTEKQLKKYFGKEWEEKRPFDWEEQFPEVFKQGGFDVVIGNPPYISTLPKEEKDYFNDNYQTRGREFDTFFLFIERSLSLLKEGGILGFIIPNTILLQKEFEKIRKFILDNAEILKIIDLRMGVFKAAVVPTAIIVMQKKKKPRSSHKILTAITSIEGLTGKLEYNTISQHDLLSSQWHKFDIYADKAISNLLGKVGRLSEKFGSICEPHEGVHSGNIREKLFFTDAKGPKYKKLLQGEDITEYQISWAGKYVNYDPKIINRAKGEYASLREERIFVEPKIMTRQTANSIIATYDDKQFYTDNSIHCSVKRLNKLYNLKYVLAILNSKLIDFVYKQLTQESGRVFPQVKIVNLKQLPVRKINFSNKSEKHKHDKLVDLANKMLELNKDLQKCAKDSDRYRAIQIEIEKVDKQIDQLVYKLYDLTPEEIEIIEEKEAS